MNPSPATQQIATKPLPLSGASSSQNSPALAAAIERFSNSNPLTSSTRKIAKPVKLEKCIKITFCNGKVGIGYFQTDKLAGISKYANGKFTFKKGNLTGEGAAILPNNTVYHGRFKNGRLNGKGAIGYPDGSLTEVEFRHHKIKEGETSRQILLSLFHLGFPFRCLMTRA